MNVMKKHPVKGVELIKHIDLFSYAVDVIHYHHERWDGKGYPDGLKEMEIPYWARIVAIADATAAMMLERQYRPALHTDKIIPEINIKNLTIEQVKAIYKRDYWDKLRLDETRNQKIAEEILDISINCGWQTAGKFVQEAINLLVTFQPIKVDGLIGEKTLMAVNSYSYPEAVVKTLNGIQFEYYRKIVTRDSSQQKWFRGWLARVEFA